MCSILARAFLDLYRAHRQGQERLAALDEAIGAAGQNALSTPWEEVRDWFHDAGNYVDSIDRAAETLAGQLRGREPSPAIETIERRLREAAIRNERLARRLRREEEGGAPEASA